MLYSVDIRTEPYDTTHSAHNNFKQYTWSYTAVELRWHQQCGLGLAVAVSCQQWLVQMFAFAVPADDEACPSTWLAVSSPLTGA